MRNDTRIDAARTGSRTVKLGEALDTYLAGSGMLVKSRELLAALVWPEVVGEWYARHTEVVRADQGVLTVHCDSAPRAQQLQLDAPEVIDRLNVKLGGHFIRELRAASGGIPRRSVIEQTAPSAGIPVEEIASWSLSSATLEQVEGLAAPIEDEGLQARFRKLLHSACKLAAWQQAHGWHPCAKCGRLVEPNEALCVACNPGRQPVQGSDEDIYDGHKPRRFKVRRKRRRR